MENISFEKVDFLSTTKIDESDGDIFMEEELPNDSQLSLDVHRCYLLKYLYLIISKKFPSVIKQHSSSNILSRWVMNEKRRFYEGMDPLLPDGHLADIVISDVIDLSHDPSLELDITVDEIKRLCTTMMDHFKNNPHPDDIKYRLIKTSGRFIPMIHVVVICESLFFNYNIDIPEYIFNYLSQTMNNSEIISLALRYESLNSLNNQLALDPKITEQIHLEFDVKGELFASCFNMHIRENGKRHAICSIFSDLEKKIGSVSSFFDFVPDEGFYIANPPYDLVLMEDMANKLIEWLKSPKKLAFMSVLPVWDLDGINKITGKSSEYGEFRGLKILVESGYLKLRKIIHQSHSCFINKMTSRYIFPCNIHFIIVSNYNFPTQKFYEMLKVYHSDRKNFIFYKSLHKEHNRISAKHYDKKKVKCNKQSAENVSGGSSDEINNYNTKITYRNIFP